MQARRHSSKLISAVRQALRDNADPAKAPPMQAYMKSEMPYLGVQTAIRREATKQVFVEHPLGSASQWQATVLWLWRKAEYREERYAAIDLAGYRVYRDYRTLVTLPMYEEMITTGAWWDYVDTIATRDVAALLEEYPGQMKRRMRSWARSGDIWKRRTSIICQLGFKERTDLKLLYDCIEPSIGEKEFFLRKAIGWALREYAKTDPDEVVRYVTTKKDVLSGLSKREALRNVVKAGLLDAIP